MRPMSLWESGESSGEVSLGELFSGNGVTTASGINLALDDLAYVCCREGWPQSVGRKGNLKNKQWKTHKQEVFD